jgi:hypothetical protein
MKTITFIIAVLCCPLFALCQDITGFWKGTMYNDSTKQSLEYEIMISKSKGKYTGITHTSYIIGSTTYYGIKKMNVRIASDGKIVMQDVKWLENNYPGEQPKNVIQLNVLNHAHSGDETFMDGLFVTNRSKAFNTLTGRLSLKKVNALVAQRELAKYILNKPVIEDITAGH